VCKHGQKWSVMQTQPTLREPLEDCGPGWRIVGLSRHAPWHTHPDLQDTHERKQPSARKKAAMRSTKMARRSTGGSYGNAAYTYSGLPMGLRTVCSLSQSQLLLALLMQQHGPSAPCLIIKWGGRPRSCVPGRRRGP
jgi:hypothetical protein